MTATPTEGVTQADIIERDWALKVNAETIARQKAKVERLREIIQEAVDHADADEGEYDARCVDSVNMLRRFLAGES